MSEYIENIDGQYALIEKGRFDSGFFHIYENLDLDNCPRKVEIYLPISYHKSKKRYPVVYMNDGHTAFHPRGLSPWFWEVDNTLDQLYKEKAIHEIIVVAVHPLDRNYEYLREKNYIPPKQDAPTGGGLIYYTSYVAHKLKPFIDKNYRTMADRESTAIVGSSFGGMAALYIGCTHGEIFGNIGALSPSLWLGNDIYNGYSFLHNTFFNEILNYLKYYKKYPKLWIDWSSYEDGIKILAEKFIQYLIDNYNFQLEENLFKFEDRIGKHDERAWEYRFNLFLRKIFSKK